MTASRAWHLWSARNWPASAEEEQRFAAELHVTPATSTQRRATSRASITAVLNALRTGLDLTGLLETLPGCDRGELATAYALLHHLLATSRNAWLAVVSDPTWTSVEQHAGDAAVLLPVPVHRVLTTAAHTSDPGALARAVAHAQLQVSTHAAISARIEATLAASVHPRDDTAAVTLAAQLHNPSAPALWAAPYYLPTRVTCLSSQRVVDLLGERGGRAPAED